MVYRVRISKHVQKQLDGLPQPVYARVQQSIRGLRTNPRPVGVKELKGFADTYRLRVGDFRIV